MCFGDKSCSSGKLSNCIDKKCLDFKQLTITSVENRQLHFQFNISGSESKSESMSLEVHSSTCILVKHSPLEEWKLQKQPGNQGHVGI